MAKKSTFCEIGILDTPRRVIKALGGREAVARITGVSSKTVSAWQTWLGYVPAKHYAVVTKELAKHGLEASSEVWNMTDEVTS